MFIVLVLIALLLSGCNSYTYNVSEETVPTDTVITLDENQSIGFVPNANNNVQIINIGEGAYYVTCDGSQDCAIHIGDINDDSDNSSTVTDTTTTTTDNNSSS